MTRQRSVSVNRSNRSFKSCKTKSLVTSQVRLTTLENSPTFFLLFVYSLVLVSIRDTWNNTHSTAIESNCRRQTNTLSVQSSQRSRAGPWRVTQDHPPFRKRDGAWPATRRRRYGLLFWRCSRCGAPSPVLLWTEVSVFISFLFRKWYIYFYFFF